MTNKSEAASSTQPEVSERFTNGKHRITTQAEVDAKWGLDGNPHMCDMCGHLFQVGDGWRWQYMNNHSPSYGNFSVCDACDGPDVKERWLAAGKLAHEKHTTPIMLALRIVAASRTVEQPEGWDVGALLSAARDLLEWMPVYSKGSSGYGRTERLKAEVEKFGKGGSLNQAVGVEADLKHPAKSDTGGEIANSILDPSVAEREPQWADCPRCRQKVLALHECYESVLNEGEREKQLTVEIARELYDRFVCGAWIEQDAYPQIREWIRDVKELVAGSSSRKGK
jgi:hypothetical protein